VPDDEAPAVEQDTPESEDSTPEGTPEDSAPSVDWEKRYGDLRPEYDRQQQLISAARRGDPDAIAELGFQVVDEEPEDHADDEDDYDDPLERRLAEVEARQQAQAEAQQAEEFEQLVDAYLEQELGRIEKDAGRKFTEEQKWLIGSAAIADWGDEDTPDVQAAFERYGAAAKAEREDYIRSKRAPRAPSGQKGERHKDLNTPEEIAQALAEEMEAEIDASS